MTEQFYTTPGAPAVPVAPVVRARAELGYLPVEPPCGTDFPAVAPGIRWARVPLAMNPDHINVWLVEDGARTVLVDTGMDGPAARDFWTAALQAPLLRERPLGRIVVTHGHADHVGLAAWLAATTGASVVASRGTRALVAETLDGGAPREPLVRWLAAHGIADVEELLGLIFGDDFRGIVSGQPPEDVVPTDGHVLATGDSRWTALLTEGHADGHLCWYDSSRSVLVSGDQVLPTISPNIGLYGPPAGRDPLGDYLASLARLRRLPADTLVLPAHGRPFRSLHARVEELVAHHHASLAQLVDACAQPRSATALLAVLFPRRLPGFHRFLALGELFAHLEYLVRRGVLRRAGDEAAGYAYVRA